MSLVNLGEMTQRPGYLGGDWLRHEFGFYLPPKANGRKWRTPIGIDLFCGAGGFSLGMIQGGFTVVAAVDNDVHAMETYLTNLGAYPVEIHCIEPSDRKRAEDHFERTLKHRIKKAKDGPITMHTSGSNWRQWGGPYVGPVEHFWLGDAKKLTGRQILDALGLERGDVDIVFGGPPCQGFSTSGKRDVMDPRNSLVLDFARLVTEINPKSVCMENVPGILSMVTPEGIPVVDAICRVLEDGGFGALDAIKKSLASTAGVGMSVRNPARRISRKQAEAMERGDEDDASPGVEQLSLLGNGDSDAR